MSASIIDQAMKQFGSNPQSAKTTPAVTAVLANGHARLSAGPFNWDADLPASLGGGNQAPSPTAYVLGALAGCAVAFLADTLAPQFGVEIDELTATARCSADLAGLLGIDGSVPDLQQLTVDIEVVSPSPDGRVEAMRQAWLDRCPIYLALLKAADVTVMFRRVEGRRS
jgi:uncharacterized OsmC-like protein